jgi:cell division protein ZipA
MDKELLRVVIILIGMLVMIGMLLWHFFKSLRERREVDDYFDDSEYGLGSDDFEVDDDDEMDIFPMREPVDGDALLDEESIKPTHKESPQPAPKTQSKTALPRCIEASHVSLIRRAFNAGPLSCSCCRCPKLVSR